MNNMLTVEEVKNYLEIEQNEVERLLQDGKLRAFKIGGSYIRFRKEEVETLRYELLPSSMKSSASQSVVSKVGDFWRFNNFYIVSLVLVAALIYFMVGI